jgi:cystathionine beta-synthase
MKKHGISQLPVLDGERLVGIISEGDLVQALLSDPENIERPISGLVDQNYVVVPPETPVARLAAIFGEGKVALVQEGKRICGLVTKIDLIDHMADRMR